MRMPSLSSLSPKAVKSRLGNRKRTTSTSSECSTITVSSTTSTATTTTMNKFEKQIMRQPSSVSLYGLCPSRSVSSIRLAEFEWEDSEVDPDELSLLEPRPREQRCMGLFELMDKV
ncbi:hypothetical protein RUND412_008275 [Rhizina undulata]